MDPVLNAALDTVSSSYAVYAPSIGVLGSTAAVGYYILSPLWQPDNTPVNIVQQDDKKITELPPSVKSSVPVVIKNKIDLPSSLDLTTYQIHDLKADRSFIRAFYFIRFNRDPSDEELNTFVETDIIQRFLNYPTKKMNRVFYVMHFVRMDEKAPYINFCKIRNAGLKTLDKKSTVTIEDVLKAAEASDTLITHLNTTRPLISQLSNLIQQQILSKNAAFFTQDATKQESFIKQYSSNNTAVLQLFNRLSALTSNKDSLYKILEECLNDECKNLTVKGSQHMKNDESYIKFIKTLNNNKTSPEVNFPFRCGIGDMLAEAKTKEKVCVTYIKEEDKEHHNYGCDNRNSLDRNRYIIYMYKEDHHCVLLIPKTLAPSSKVPESKPKPSNPVVPSSNNTSKTVAVEIQNKNNNSPNVSVAPATDTCKKYEDEYFSKGGRNKKQKRVTKRRRRSKSRRKGTRRI